MISMRFIAAAIAALFCATPMLAHASDVQIRVNFFLVAEDPQEGIDANSSIEYDLGEGSSLAFGYAGFLLPLGLPRTHETAAEITLDGMISDRIEVQTFLPRNQQWNFTDTNEDRSGTIQLRAEFNVNWNLEFKLSGNSFAQSYLQYDRFDADDNFQQSLGSFDCTSISGADPTCSGAGFGMDDLSIVFNGMSWDITGPVYLPFTAGEVNSNDNYFGLSTGTYIRMGMGGVAGDFLHYGAGNHVSLDLTSTEESVTVVPVPEPSLAGLQFVALLVVAAARRWSVARLHSGGQ